MPNDDFLKQFEQAPPDEFAKELLEKLKQLDTQATDSKASSASVLAPPVKQALVFVPAPRTRARTVDHYITAIASIALLLLFSSILIVSFGNKNSVNNQNVASLALPMVNATGLSQLAWSPDANLLYVVDAAHLYLLDLQLQLVDSIPLELNGSVTAMTFVNDGAALVLGDSSGTVTLWSTETQEVLYSLPTHRSAVQVLVWIERNHRLLSASLDSDLVVLDVRADILLELERESVSEDSVPMFISGLSVHPNGHDMIATMNNSATFIYQLEPNGSLNLSHDDFSLARMPPTLQTAFGSGGERITYVWWDNLVVLDSHTLAERYRYTLPERFQWLRPLQMSENGFRLLLSNNRNQIAIWDFSTESYIPIFDVSRALNHELRSVLHPNGQLVAAIMPSNEVHLWQVNHLTDETFDVVEIAVNRPGVNLSNNATADATLRPISNGTTGDLVELFSFGDGFLTQTLWSPDGSQLIVTSTSTIRVYDDALRLQREWALVGIDVIKSAFSKDGQYLLTASSTGTITVWNVATGQIISSIANVHNSPVTMLTVLDNSNRIISRDESGEFAYLIFSDSTLSLSDRFSSFALSSYDVVDWHLEDETLRLVMMREARLSANPSDLINVVDFDLNADFEAQTTTTAIAGTLSTFTEDGQTLLVYNRDWDSISLYDSHNFEWQDAIPVPDSLVSAVYMQRDALTGHILLVDYDNELYVYEQPEVRMYQIHETNALLEQPAATIALNPNAELISIIVSHNHIILGRIEATNGQYVLSEIAADTPVLGQIQTFIIGPNNVAATSTTDGAVLLFDTITGNLLRRISLSTWGVRNHDLAFNASGTMLVVLGNSITGFDSVVNILDVQAAINGDADVHLSDSPYYFEREYLSGMAFDPERDWLISGGSQVRTWNLSDEPFQYVNAYDLHGLTIFAYHPYEAEVATLRPGNYLRVVSTDNMLYRYSTRIYNRSMVDSTFLQYTPDGTAIIVAAEGQTPEIYDAASGDSLLELTGYPNERFSDMTLGHDGSYLFAADKYGLFMWDIQAAYRGDTTVQQVAINFAVQQVAVSADGTRLFLVAQDGTVHVMGIPQN